MSSLSGTVKAQSDTALASSTAQLNPLLMADQLTLTQARLILNALPEIGPITLNRLLEDLGGDPREVLRASPQQLESTRGVGPKISATVHGWRSHFDLPREESRMADAHADFIVPEDELYPPLLREISDPPIGLYRKGNYDFSLPSIAIVGSRRTTLYGQAIAKKFAAELARLGFCIVSGLAQGIDTAAHEGALSVGGKTVAVLGNGIDIVYPPQNLHLYRQIEATGAIVSEFPFRRRADRQTFPMRNRVISGICEAVLVVESPVSGGSMITARFAGEQNRLLCAIPGRIDQATSGGCHQLIRDGAVLATSVEDILSELNYIGEQSRGSPAIDANNEGKTSSPNLTEQEAQILACFAGGAILTPDTLAAQTGLSASALAPALMMLELKHRLTRRLDGSWESRSGH